MKCTFETRCIFLFFVIVLNLNGSLSAQNPIGNRVSPWAKARAYVDTAWEYLYSEPDLTLVYAKKLLDLAEDENMTRPKSSAHSLLGLYHEATGDYGQSIRHYHKAIEILRPHDSLHIYLNSAYANISIVYHYSGNYRNAIDYRKKGLKIELANNSTEDAASSYSALGNFYQKLDKPDSALYFFQKALDYKKEYPYLAAMTYANMGEIYVKRKQWDSAYQAFKYNYDYVYGHGDRPLLEKLDANYDLADYYILTENYAEALPYLRTATRLADSLESLEYRADLLMLYSHYHEGIGNVPRSFDYYKKARNLRDSIAGAEVQSVIAELEAKYQHEKQSAEINELKSDAALKDLMIEKQEEQNTYLVILSILSGVILLLILILYFSTKRKTKKLKVQNEIIKQSHNDLEEMMRESHHRIKNNLQVVSSLLKMQSKNADSPEARASLMEAYSRIKTIAMMHRRLQGSHSFKTVEMHEFINQLTDSIKSSLTEEGSEIDIVADVDTMEMETDKSIAVGLVVNEAVTNSLKHAFIGKKGRIKVDMHHQEEAIFLEISDNGNGLPQDFDPREDGNLGFKIIRSLATKLNGKLNISQSQGLHINIKFPSALPH